LSLTKVWRSNMALVSASHFKRFMNKLDGCSSSCAKIVFSYQIQDGCERNLDSHHRNAPRPSSPSIASASCDWSRNAGRYLREKLYQGEHSISTAPFTLLLAPIIWQTSSQTPCCCDRGRLFHLPRQVVDSHNLL